MQLIDLSSPIDASAWEAEPVVHEVVAPADGAKHMSEEMSAHFGIEFDPDELPGGELLSIDNLTLTSHTGTHVDAPSHYGSSGSDGGRLRTIDELPLDWFHGPGVLIDISDHPQPLAGVAEIRARVDELSAPLERGHIVLLHTGAAAWAGTPRYFTDFVGLDGEAVEFLLDRGVRVIGTDAFSLDAPFAHMIEEFRRRGDPSVLWPAHFTGRRREYCQIERMANLDQLPRSQGFDVSCFPVKIAGGGAGWTRAVAHVGSTDASGRPVSS